MTAKKQPKKKASPKKKLRKKSTKKTVESSGKTARNVRGRPFQKGKSGNPGGRPKDVNGVRELARSYAPEAIEVLRKLMNSSKTPAAARVSAASALLDRGYGKPAQSVDVQGGVTITKIERVIVDDTKNRDS